MSPTPSKDIDTVCRMNIDPRDAAGEHVYQGQTYFFCNPGCLAKFKADPGKYRQRTARETESPAPPETRYVCPMDPEVQQDRPGACPKCGMALEPDLATMPAARVEYTCPMHPEIVRDE